MTRSSVFVPLPLSRWMSLGGPDPVPAAAKWHPSLAAVLASLPGGETKFWGVPFQLGSESMANRWVWVGSGARTQFAIPIKARFTHLVIAHFSAPPADSANPLAPEGPPSGWILDPGRRLADYCLMSQGSVDRHPIRRRIEVNDVIVSWGQLAFAARPHRTPRPRDWRGPHEEAMWGVDQTTIDSPDYAWSEQSIGGRYNANYWIYALENRNPDSMIDELRIESRGTGLIALAGLTLFTGSDNPLRHAPSVPLLIESQTGDRPDVGVDLGEVARTYQPAAGLDGESNTPGWGAPSGAPIQHRLIVEVAAAADAQLDVSGEKIALSALRQKGTIGGLGVGPRITVLPRADQVVEVTVTDAATGEPIPCRVHFRSPDGRYLPPVGHRHEVNTTWFEDYGSDLKLGATQYAYVEGRFRIALPPGQVFVEVVRGFEYEPLRTSVQIETGRPRLSLELQRLLDARGAGWVSADTHVHFISPDTAGLQGAAEGVDVINVLATQWGDLFTNVGDFSGHTVQPPGRNVIVHVGSENRQHLLGHLSMLGIGTMGTHLTTGGPPESWIGDPVSTSLATWSDECRKNGGIVVIPHFPLPLGEALADVILGKVDGVELRDFRWGINSRAVHEWYRLLNCGFRVAAVGGTDKMSAGMPVGGVRTYTRIGEEPLTFEAWATGVRAGRTVTSSGPMIEFSVEETQIGDELHIANERVVEVSAVASSAHPLERLEIVHNGSVVADVTGTDGPRELRLSERLTLSSGWVAARCEGSSVAWHEWPVRMAAHTSPIYLRGPHQPMKEDVSYIEGVLQGGLAWLDTIATQASPEAHDDIRSVFLRAQSELDRLRGRI